MPARSPLVNQLRRLVRLETSAEAFGEDRVASFTNFELLPATAVAAGSDKLVLLSGTGTEVVTRAPKGGVRIETQATNPADGDQVQLAGVANTNFGLASSEANSFLLVTATSEIQFSARVSFAAITTMFGGIGLDENITDVDPSGTAGDGARFLFAPVNAATELAVDPGLTTAQYANWICHTKVAGVDVFTATTVPVTAATDYKLQITFGTDLKPRFYINNSLVHTGTTAFTADNHLAVMGGVELTGTPGGVRSVDIRYIKVSRKNA